MFAVVAWMFLEDAPGRLAPTTSLAARLKANARLPITWQASILYAVAFGGYVAFSVYLPAFLKTDYQLTPADAANRMAGFVIVAVIMRPVGGWLSDRVGPIPVLASGYVVVVVCAGFAATHPILEHAGTAAFLIMAMALGSGTGATFALIAKVTDPSRVGGVTGLVGAAGGLGGFVPPLIMGYVYGHTDSYAIGLWMLSATAALTAVLTVTIVRQTAQSPPRPPAQVRRRAERSHGPLRRLSYQGIRGALMNRSGLPDGGSGEAVEPAVRRALARLCVARAQAYGQQTDHPSWRYSS